MKVHDPLLQAWQKTLERRRDHGAILDEQGWQVRTFQQVEDRAVNLVDQLRKFEPGTVIGVQIGNHADWPSIILAALRQRLPVVPIDQSASAQDRATALEICRGSGLITAAPGNAQTNRGADLTICSLSADTIDWGDDIPALLKLTSGTTAAPRAIRFQSAQLFADCVQICDTMGISEADVNFGVIPISHSYGFSNLLTPLIVRGVPVALSSDRLPRAVLHNLGRSGATVFPGMPVFYQSFHEIGDAPILPALRLCISAGAPLPAPVATQFEDKFNLRIHSFYGSSECGGICYDTKGQIVGDGFVGKEMNGVTIEPLSAGPQGTQVRVRSAAVADGYFPQSEEIKLSNGAFTPDDVLTSSPAGWRIVGRVSDLINVAGKKVNPAEVEAELLAITGVRDAVVFGRTSSVRNEEVAACVVAAEGISETDLLKICRRRLSGWQVPKRIFMLDQLPVNERGKISRRELGTRFGGQ
ncbi:MAG: class I adenylate-forming enzyme family protein [Chthoniobacterales bacterium]